MKKKTKPVDKALFDDEGYQTNIKDLNGDPLPNIAKLDFQPFGHGGTRPGAGRKPSGRTPVLLRLSPKLVASLRKEASRNRLTLSEVAERRLAHGK